MTKRIDLSKISELIHALENGDVVSFPTDTVYGLACIPYNAEAIAKMKWVKGRDEKKPFPMMVSSAEQVDSIAFVNESAKLLIQNFMPGAFTIVLNKKECISDEITNGQSTIAIRMPDDEVVLSILKQTGPLLVTSANLSDHPSCTNSNEVLEQLDGRISMILLGESGNQMASTIVDCTSKNIKILREGIIPKETIRAIIK